MSETGSTADRLQEMLASSGIEPLDAAAAVSLQRYLHLLQRWNAKMNLTAIRDETAILEKHFLESIQCARLLPRSLTSLMDFGSGAGFPGIPCAICRPDLNVTLAESQGKKAAFLREAVRILGLRVAVHAGRAEALPTARRFDAVTLRAVDQMERASHAALGRIDAGGWIVILTTETGGEGIKGTLRGVNWSPPVNLIGSEHRILLLGRKS